MEATSSSSSRVSAAKTTELTADGIAATRTTTARSIPVNPSNHTAAKPNTSPPPIRTTTPSMANRAVRRTAEKLIDSPSTKLASGVVVTCNGLRTSSSQGGR